MTVSLYIFFFSSEFICRVFVCHIYEFINLIFFYCITIGDNGKQQKARIINEKSMQIIEI